MKLNQPITRHHVKNFLFWVAVIYVAGFVVACFAHLAQAQLAPPRDIAKDKSLYKTSTSAVAHGTQPMINPAAPVVSLPDTEPLGDVARRNRLTHPMTIDIQDFTLVCRDWTPGETCLIENKRPQPQKQESQPNREKQ